MPSTNVLALEKVQAAIEVTRGTDVPATRKVYATLVGSIEREVAENENSTGTFADDGTIAFLRAMVGFTAKADLTYEDLAWWFKLALKGGVTATSDGGVPPAYPYIFVPTIASDDLNSTTVEFNESGLPYQATQFMVDEWTVEIDPDKHAAWKWSAKCRGRDWVPTTYTGSIGERTTEAIKAPGIKLYIDAGGGTIGTTQVLGKLIKAVVTGKNQLHFKGFAEDEQWVAANKVGRGKQLFDAEITFEWDSDTEFANFRAATPPERKVRLEAEGSIIHTTVKKRARLDLNGYWSTWEPSDREGNKTMVMNLTSRYNIAAGYKLAAEVKNALATLV